MFALAVAVSGGVLFSSPVHAQGRPMRFVGPPHGMPTHFDHGGIRGGRGFRHFGHRGHFVGPGYVGYPYPYFWPDGYYGEPPAPPPSPTQIVVVRQPAPPAAPPAPPAPSLMLEYRDGHWVRVPMGSEVPTSVSAVHPAPAAPSTSRKDAAIEAEETAKPIPPLPHAVLVFRNGRRLVLQRYEIHSGFIYASGDYWEAGSTARKIAISELNVPATLRLNQQLGSKFQLPSNPDEVFVSF
jgi:hypothetical protein